MYNNPFDYYQEEEKEEEKKGPAAPSCYGCVYMVASPTLDCTHPNSIRVLWDPIRNKSYRVPSILLCREHNGVCQFYKPSPTRSAEYSLQKELEKARDLPPMRERVDALIKQLEREDTLNEFLDTLNIHLREDIDKEYEEEDEENER